MNTIRVRNFEQKVLLDLELKGQISDGNWENSAPFDHWKAPCHAEVIVDPSNIGVNFHLMRKYDFTSADLLSVVRTRMITYVRLARAFGIEDAHQLEHLYETIDENCKAVDTVKFESEMPSWLASRPESSSIVARLETADSREFLESLATISTKDRKSGQYNLQSLMKDLEDLKVIFRARSN